MAKKGVPADDGALRDEKGVASGVPLSSHFSSLWKRAESIAESGESIDDAVRQSAAELAVPGVDTELPQRTGEYTLRAMVELALYKKDPDAYLLKKRSQVEEGIAQAKERAGDLADKAAGLYDAQRKRIEQEGIGTYSRDVAKRGLDAARGLFGRLRVQSEKAFDYLAESDIATPSERRIEGCAVQIGAYLPMELITAGTANRVSAFVGKLGQDPEMLALDESVRSQVTELYSGFATTEVGEVLERISQEPTLGGRLKDQERLLKAISLLEERRKSFEDKAYMR